MTGIIFRWVVFWRRNVVRWISIRRITLWCVILRWITVVWLVRIRRRVSGNIFWRVIYRLRLRTVIWSIFNSRLRLGEDSSFSHS